MLKKKHVVLINGGPGVGKSWLCKELRKTRPLAKQIGLNTALIETLSVITGLNLHDPFIYNEFKSTRFEHNGKTGREWMIMVSEGSKEFDPCVWAKSFMTQIRISNATLILCDSFGFPIEFEYFLAQEDIETLNVYIDEDRGECYTTEGPYRQFDGDSRLDLSRHCSIRSVDSNAALVQVNYALTMRGW